MNTARPSGPSSQLWPSAMRKSICIAAASCAHTASPWLASIQNAMPRARRPAGLALDYISINVSAAQIFHRDYATELIDEYCLDGRHLQMK